jgi:hypothetical protein
VRKSDTHFHRRAIAPALISGFITLSAGLAALSWDARVNRIQVTWIILAAGSAALFTGYRLVTATRAASIEAAEISAVSSKVDDASEVLSRIDARGRDSTLVLLARIMTICTEQAVSAAYELDLFNALVQSSMECLYMAIAYTYGTDCRDLRVAVLTCQQNDTAGRLTGTQDLVYYPDDHGAQIKPTEETMDHAAILMSRRHPYENGWLRYSGDGLPVGPEGHILPPQDDSVVSYIRVGIPQVGVLLVDSWDISLSVAERRLTAAFADVLALPYSAKRRSVPAVPAQATGGRELEGTQ